MIVDVERERKNSKFLIIYMYKNRDISEVVIDSYKYSFLESS